MVKRLISGTSQRQLEIERRDAGSSPTISGYGAVFYNAADPGSEYWLWSDVVERVMPGAFDRALREDDVRSFFNHDPNLILGRTTAKTLSLSIDSVGLRYDVSPSVSAFAQHAVEAVTRGDVSGSSFMFDVVSATWVEQPDAAGDGTLWIRQITEVKLYEIGPVAFPAYDGTTAEVTGRNSGGENELSVSPAATRWRDWHSSHLTRARESLAEFRALRGTDDDAKQRRQRLRRALELRSKV